MNIAIKQEQLDVLLQLGRRMQASAEAGDWDTVDYLQQKCQQLAGDLFAEPVNVADRRVVQAVSAAIKEILAINKSVVELGVVARDVCLGELDQFQTGRKAVKEYQSNTR